MIKLKNLLIKKYENLITAIFLIIIQKANEFFVGISFLYYRNIVSVY